MRKKIFFILFVLLFIFAFAFYAFYANQKKETLTSIRGIDTNQNGIRDDIDSYIEKETATRPKLKAIGIELAKNLQLSMENLDMALELGRRDDSAILCAEYLEIDLDEQWAFFDEIEALTVNSEERAKAYSKHNLKLSGKTFGGTPEARHCDFDPSILGE